MLRYHPHPAVALVGEECCYGVRALHSTLIKAAELKIGTCYSPGEIVSLAVIKLPSTTQFDQAIVQHHRDEYTSVGLVPQFSATITPRL